MELGPAGDEVAEAKPNRSWAGSAARIIKRKNLSGEILADGETVYKNGKWLG